ncbi:CRISPR-associated endonuclease Cas1 [Sphaerochaeta pleomorpha str. Grapes]|uniref:CRISPR-associated endonuclease Cas1 n=1 Tax=Sphaerochaeta pleomorpha (strain ATCC BAA-1885 / DSM 22778 / Grapes) TaxID=158190 RepID=G8QQN8_SPHPG|nr:type I-C CRISPR-associated endonuclease Cas1c [Sphaerochaeta pleomorpha]AEV30968.1 CRISPR-associated endonuclease Cas1 [Sphaerochaeta pleomorpha str. Grapes]
MIKLLNTLYVSSQGSYLRKEGETVVVELATKKVLQIPIHTIKGIVCFGNVLCSPFLLGFCSEKNVSVSFMTEYGRFLASVRGPVSGNVLLRRQQYRFADDSEISTIIVKNLVSAKIVNCRIVLNRAMRDHGTKFDIKKMKESSISMDRAVSQVLSATSVDEVRGYEGLAAAEYFSVFNDLIVSQKEDFIFQTRNRRPPLDEVNALLSFIYTLLSHDVRSALETVGLDPSVGFLHCDRSGRYGLALDMMEEFRPVIADRLVLSLINRGQVKKNGFYKAINGAITMDDDTRKLVLVEYQKRKQEQIHHPFINEDIQIGLLFHVQATLLARYIRGDIDGYPPFFWR